MAIKRIGLVAMAAVVAGLAGCGGGGSSTPAPAPIPDARNGTYSVFAADARQYTLALDFDAKTWQLTGNGLNQSSSFAADGSAFVFAPAPASGNPNNARFFQANDAVIGGFNFGAGVVPFVAPRSFATTVAEAAGKYNFLTTTHDTAAPSNNAIFTGEITAAGVLNTCNDLTIYAIEKCPFGSVISATLTVADSVFTATTPTGAYSFRVAKVGTDKVFLRAGASLGTSRRFWIGTPLAATYPAASFTGADSLGGWGTTNISTTAYSASGMGSTGTAFSRSGTVSAINNGNPGSISPTGMLFIATPANGNYFSIRAANVAVLAAGRDNPFAPGYMEIGKP